MIYVTTQDVLRRFRIQFLDFDSKSGAENCLECGRELACFFPLIEKESASSLGDSMSKSSLVVIGAGDSSRMNTSASRLQATGSSLLNESFFSTLNKSSTNKFSNNNNNNTDSVSAATAVNTSVHLKDLTKVIIKPAFLLLSIPTRIQHQ